MLAEAVRLLVMAAQVAEEMAAQTKIKAVLLELLIQAAAVVVLILLQALGRLLVVLVVLVFVLSTMIKTIIKGLRAYFLREKSGKRRKNGQVYLL